MEQPRRTEDCGGNELDLTAGVRHGERRTMGLSIQRISRRGDRAVICVLPSFVDHTCIRVIRAIRGEFLLLLFLAEFLETRIAAERIEHRIEPEQPGSKRGPRRHRTTVRHRE